MAADAPPSLRGRPLRVHRRRPSLDAPRATVAEQHHFASGRVVLVWLVAEDVAVGDVLGVNVVIRHDVAKHCVVVNLGRVPAARTAQRGGRNPRAGSERRVQSAERECVHCVSHGAVYSFSMLLSFHVASTSETARSER